MKSTNNKRIKLDLSKLVGFNQVKASQKGGLRAAVGVKAGAKVGARVRP